MASATKAKATTNGKVSELRLNQPGHHVVDVTPETAERWLELNIKNRRLRPAKVEQYTRDMRKEGGWRFTGEAIKFNDQGHLVDGQNRLTALVEADTTLPFLVVTGLEETAQEVMDSGVSRTAGDALTFLGYSYPNEIAAAVRVHYMWTRMVYRTCMTNPSGDLMPTNTEIVQHLEEHPGLASASVRVKPITRQLHLSLGAVASAYYEFTKIDPDAAEDFVSRIATMQLNGRGDPIAALVKRAGDMAMRREFVRPATALFLVIRTWNAYRSGEHLEKFSLGAAPRWALIPAVK